LSGEKLKENVVFQGKMRYHNLKKEELGALLSALTFHGTKETFHNIGMAKALGYGKIKISIDGSENFQEYLKEFEMLMLQEVEGWSESVQIKELFSMAVEQQNSKSSSLKYLDLKEFAKLKNGQNYLKNYTQLENIKTCTPLSLVNEADLEALNAHKKELLLEKEAKERAKKIEMEYLEILESKNIQKIDSFLSKHPDFEKAQELQELKMTLEQQQTESKFQKVNEAAQNAWDSIHDPKYKSKLQKALQGFIKKWEKKNKGSEFVLELVERAKQELK
jgi:hypothetical protein